MTIDMQKLQADLGEELTDVCQSLAARHNLRFGYPELLVFEFMLQALRVGAPMEFEEYLAEIMKKDASVDEVNFLRSQLTDTLNLTTNP